MIGGRTRDFTSRLRPSSLPPLLAFAATLVLLNVLAPAGSAWAGPNAGGCLILHANQELEFTNDGDYRGYSDLYEAKTAVTQVTGDGKPVVYFVLAAFDDFASPRLKALAFGIETSSAAVDPIASGFAGDLTYDFIVPGDGWPASRTGVGINFSEPRTRRLEEIYWFASYAYPGQTVKVTKHPDHGGQMVDDSQPSEVDEIAGYGTLGFGTRGYNPMSGEVATGACCNSSGRCIMQSEEGCRAFSASTYQGDNTFCNPNPCTPGVGACCVRIECQMLQWDQCNDAHGLFQGEGVGCDPTPCDFTRVETTWGSLKSTYRDNWRTGNR